MEILYLICNLYLTKYNKIKSNKKNKISLKNKRYIKKYIKILRILSKYN